MTLVLQMNIELVWRRKRGSYDRGAVKMSSRGWKFVSGVIYSCFEAGMGKIDLKCQRR